MSSQTGGGRASIFGDDDFDLSDFQPRPPAHKAAPPEEVRAISERASFRSREPKPAAPAAPAAPPAEAPARRAQRRHRTGRNAQLNIKVRPETLNAFHALVDRHGWVQGEAFERAIAALERELAGRA
ncbi:stability/partitioning determinant [Geminicoccus flavidas]|uniref:stability/partitioning determinant n=1 Tax=Geminicoccus flavidas TaxID=2506407 RepID=UPI00135C6EE8|nr:stability/partitioning determinant [Geminicoccus flavidas]